jgi:hypothetical protein
MERISIEKVRLLANSIDRLLDKEYDESADITVTRYNNYYKIECKNKSIDLFSGTAKECYIYLRGIVDYLNWTN